MKTRIGTFLSLGSPAIAELAALSGFDWVLIDLEHGSGSESAVPDQLRALRGSETKGIVRIGAPHADLVARVLDWGAHGIMVPHVDSAATAASIVQAAHYAPRGNRGYSRSVRAHDYGLRPPEQTPAPIVMAQIESAEAVRHAGEIAVVDGVDVLFVGPSDLQCDLENRAAAAPGGFDDCLRIVAAAAKTAGKAAGILLRAPADVSRHREMGFSYIAVESDLAVLRNGWRHTASISR